VYRDRSQGFKQVLREPIYDSHAVSTRRFLPSSISSSLNDPNSRHQNGQQIRPIIQHQPQFVQQPSFDNPSYFSLDPSTAAKQMAALNAANMTRIATNGRPQPNPAFSSVPYPHGIPSVNHTLAHDPPPNSSTHPTFQLPNHHDNTFPSPSSATDAPMSLSNNRPRIPSAQAAAAASVKQRRRNFLMGLASVMASRNTPLPPALTGVPYPQNHDPSNSHWKMIDISPDQPGAFRLAGKDVDLFKLWGVVFQAGGGTKVCSSSPCHCKNEMASRST
jgi:SWI/SNF chromatin-remodeling complex subunit SWI1